MKRARLTGWRRVLLAVSVALASSNGVAQATGKELLLKLGYPDDARLLILHADDLGMSHSVDAASFEALQGGFVSSASIMVPSPWFTEAAAFARQHPEYDFGLHLTLTSEWSNYRWGPVLGKSVPSLLDAFAYLPSTSRSVANAKPDEVRLELAAQVQRARDFGIRFSHLDNHMGALSQSAELFGVYLRTAREAGVPNLVYPGEVKAFAEKMPPSDLNTPVPTDLEPESNPDPVEGFRAAFSKLQPGLYVAIVHLGHDDSELQAIMGTDAGGARSRQADFETVTSPRFRQALRDYHVELVTWRDVAARFYSGSSEKPR